MARRMPKFPLKMANGANVRNLEDLRTNADIESIVNYYLSGQLSLWCRAFGYDAVPEKLECITFELIKNIYDTFEIPFEEQDIKEYISNHTINTTVSVNHSEPKAEDEIEIDYEFLKLRLSHLKNVDSILQNFTIAVSLILNEEGNAGKYRVEVEEKEMQQYMSFVSPYNAKHQEDSLEQLYQNIAFTVENMSLRATMVKDNHVILFSTIDLTYCIGKLVPFPNVESKNFNPPF